METGDVLSSESAERLTALNLAVLFIPLARGRGLHQISFS